MKEEGPATKRRAGPGPVIGFVLFSGRIGRTLMT